MAYSTPIQTASGNSTSPCTATFTGTPGNGNAILISIHNTSNTTALTSVKDGNSNNATLINSEQVGGASGFSAKLYQYILIGGAAQSKSIVVTLAGASFLVAISEFSGNMTPVGSIIDNAQTAVGFDVTTVTTTSGHQPSVTTTNANDLIWTSVALNNAANAAILGSGATMIQVVPNSTSNEMGDAYQIETATGTYNPFFVWTAGGGFAREFAQITTALLPAPTPQSSMTGISSITGLTSVTF